MENKVVETVLAYIICGDEVLLLHRNKRENDYNGGKYIGVGGHLEEGETPDECLKREIFEETGLKDYHYLNRGKAYFILNGYEELMHLFTCYTSNKDVITCDEGDLVWVKKSEVFNLPMWEGDKKFVPKLIYGTDEVNIKLYYDNDKLIKIE